MAKAGFVGLTYTDSRGRRRGTRFNWHREANRLLGPAVAIALQKAGMEVRRNTQRLMVGGSTSGGRSIRKNPQWWKVGDKDGYPVVAFVRKVPNADKVSSWAPMAFLRNDIVSDYDHGTQSVVIGPSKVPWLNQLHEMGGHVRVYVNHGKYPVKEYGKHKVPRKFQGTVKLKRGGTSYRGAYVGYFDNHGGNFSLGTRTVKPRRYMQTGLQASLHKIPQQFHRTIRGVGI